MLSETLSEEMPSVDGLPNEASTPDEASSDNEVITFKTEEFQGE
jgi:hypothetical protein